jgi:uncharacterized protein
MKLIISIIFTLLVTTLVMAQSANPQLDTSLSKKMGADEYGMKMYVFVILKTGENKTKVKSFIDSCFAGHMKNIEDLAAKNQLIVAGPFGKNKSNYRGLFILNVQTIAAANLLLEKDPAVKSKLLKAELIPWYGSAALPEYLNAHNKIWKTKP